MTASELITPLNVFLFGLLQGVVIALVRRFLKW